MLVAKTAEGKKAENIIVLDVKKATPLTDFFVICEGESGPQLKAISSHIEEALRSKGKKPLKWEGKLNSNWMILDLGRVVIHVMGKEERERYNLEGIWEKNAIVYHL
jgi:ribosome-associated protein